MCPTPVPLPEWVPVPGLAPLTPSESFELAATLPVSPFFVICYAGLRRGLDRAFAVGPPSDPEAVIVQHRLAPEEPEYFGRNPETGWNLLSRVPGWTCLNGSIEDMREFGRIFARDMSVPFRPLDDLFYTLETAPRSHPDPAVRLLGIADIPLLRNYPPKVWGNSYRTFEEMLTEGVVGGALVDRRIVSIATLTATNGRYGDIGIHTLEPYRGRGFSTAAASLVAREVRARGITPIWSTGGDNVASQRVATQVGFRPVGRWEYLVFDGFGEAGYRPSYGKKTHAAIQTP